MNEMVKTEGLKKKIFLLPLFPPQFAYELLWEWFMASAVRIRRLIPWVMARLMERNFVSVLWRWMPEYFQNGIYLPD